MMYVKNLTVNVTQSGAMARALMQALGARSADVPTPPDDTTTDELAPTLRIGQPWPGIEGSAYAGLSCSKEGQPDVHLVLLPDEPTDKLNWQAAQDWATRIGGHLPTRDESALLYAHLRGNIDDEGWYWTSTRHSAGFAWFQFFGFGSQYYNGKEYEARARAVRRFTA